MAARSDRKARPSTWNSLGESGECGRRNWTYSVALAGAPSNGRHRNGPAGRGGRHGSGEAGHPGRVRDIGPGGEEAAVTQHLGDSDWVRPAVEQRHSAAAAEAVRAEPAHLHPCSGERTAAPAHEPGPRHLCCQIRGGVETRVHPLAADGQAVDRQPLGVQWGGQGLDILWPVGELVRPVADLQRGAGGKKRLAACCSTSGGKAASRISPARVPSKRARVPELRASDAGSTAAWPARVGSVLEPKIEKSAISGWTITSPSWASCWQSQRRAAPLMMAEILASWAIPRLSTEAGSTFDPPGRWRRGGEARSSAAGIS